MTKHKVYFGSPECGGWVLVGFGRSLLGIIFVGLMVPMQILSNTNVTENNAHRTGRSSASSEDPALPPNILTASHLSYLRDLLSDKKITVRLGLCVSLNGPSEFLDPQLIFLNKESRIYNTGGKPGPFTMRIVGVKKVTSTT